MAIRRSGQESVVTPAAAGTPAAGTEPGGGTAAVALLESPADALGESALASHLLALPGESWALWRCAALRGAGFPVTDLVCLAAPAAAAAADRLQRAEADLDAAIAAALAAIDGALRALRRDGGWEDDALRKPLLKMQRSLLKRRVPEPAAAAPAGAEPAAAVAAGLAAAATAERRLGAARLELVEEIAAAARRTSDEIRRVASSARFQEALLWQNRRACHHLRESLIGKPGAARNSRRRQNEELVASYLQRYCAKNDTIGFFGPVGWAELSDRGPALRVRPGPGLLASREVFLEAWGVDTLARALAADRALLLWMAPRLLPAIRFEGDTLRLPGKPPAKLPPAQAALLRACDGTRSARELAARFRHDGVAGLRNEREIFGLLDYMRKTGVLEWELQVPVEPHAMRTLRRQLADIGDEPLRLRALGAVAELEAARAEVAAAGGRVEDLDLALGRFEATFTRLTQAAPTRAPGQTYAARTLLYEDCRRDLELTLGPAVLAALGPPLSLLLASARWFTHTAAELCRPAFRRIYDDLVRDSGSPAVEALQFWYRLQALLFAEQNRLSDAALPDFQRRWAELLPHAAEDRRVSWSSAELAPRVLAAFDAPRAGWQVGRYHSPDVLIAAASPEALAGGDFELVLGEMHMGANTLNTWVFMAQHPAPETAARALAADLPEPRIVPLSGKHWPGLTTRTQITFFSPRDFRLASTHCAAGVAPAQVLAIGALLIELEGGQLVVRTHDRRLRCDLLDLFADALTFMVGSSFKLLAERPHSPRLTIDRLVVARETWRFAAAEVPFAEQQEAAERFAVARRWAAAHGLPRYVFVKSPVEKKPFYVDFDSPVFIDLLAKTVRRTAAAAAGPGGGETAATAAWITVTEMLPSPDQAWLPDAAGNRYASELRLVALDLAGR